MPSHVPVALHRYILQAVWLFAFPSVVTSILAGSATGVKCPPGFPLDPKALGFRNATQEELLRGSRLERSRHDLRECVNLIPAGTGTQSLVDLLQRATNTTWFHDHDLRVENHASVPCFVMTIRDPVARLESGFLWDVMMAGEMSKIFNRGQKGSVAHLRDWLAALRDPGSRAYPSVMRNYFSSVSSPTAQVWQLGVGQTGGSNFLVSQVDPLRFWSPERHELHFVCTERFDEDFAALLKRFGLPSGAGMVHRNRRRPAGRLSPEDAAFVRECLYPWDADLHRKVCGGPMASGHGAH